MLQAALFQHVEHVRGRTLPESPTRASQHLVNAPLQRQRLGGLADSFELRVEARVLQSGALEDLDPSLMSLLGHLSACGLNQPVDVPLDRCANALAHFERLGVLGIEGQGFVGGGRCRAEGAGIELLPRAVERRGNALGPFAQTAPLGLEPLVLGTDLLQQLVEPRLGLRRVCQGAEHAECLVDAAGRERVACTRHLLEAPLPFLRGPSPGLFGSPRRQCLLDLGAQRQGRCKRVIESEHGVNVRARCFEILPGVRVSGLPQEAGKLLFPSAALDLGGLLPAGFRDEIRDTRPCRLGLPNLLQALERHVELSLAQRLSAAVEPGMQPRVAFAPLLDGAIDARAKGGGMGQVPLDGKRFVHEPGRGLEVAPFEPRLAGAYAVGRPLQRLPPRFDVGPKRRQVLSRAELLRLTQGGVCRGEVVARECRPRGRHPCLALLEARLLLAPQLLLLERERRRDALAECDRTRVLRIQRERLVDGGARLLERAALELGARAVHRGPEPARPVAPTFLFGNRPVEAFTQLDGGGGVGLRRDDEIDGHPGFDEPLRLEVPRRLREERLDPLRFAGRLRRTLQLPDAQVVGVYGGRVLAQDECAIEVSCIEGHLRRHDERGQAIRGQRGHARRSAVTRRIQDERLAGIAGRASSPDRSAGEYASAHAGAR